MTSPFARYIGMPWVAGAEGPSAWDCHAFTRHIQAVHFGVDIPRLIIPDYNDKRALVGLCKSTLEGLPEFIPVTEPIEGDVVLIRTPLHTGTYIEVEGEPCVLHCVRNAGVLISKCFAWSFSGFGRRQYLRHESRL